MCRSLLRGFLHDVGRLRAEEEDQEDDGEEEDGGPDDDDDSDGVL